MVSMEKRLALGLGLIIIGALALMGFSYNILLFFDNNYHEIDIANNTNATSFDFNFSKNYISNYYEVSNDNKIYLNYLNVYIEEFLDNSSTTDIPTFKLNNNEYQPINRTYEYSLQIEDNSLKDLEQNLLVNKSINMTISQITLSYKGADFTYFSNYETLMAIVGFLFIIFGILVLLSL